jgi:hypothetical protein
VVRGAQQLILPAGYRLLPEDPSLEMIAALGFGGDVALVVGHAAISEDVAKSYRDLLDAAPVLNTTGYALIPLEPTVEALTAMSIALGMEPLGDGSDGSYPITGRQSTVRQCYAALLNVHRAAGSQASSPSDSGGDSRASSAQIDLLRRARAVATGELSHLYRGSCPDAVEGIEVRDDDCPVCQVLQEIDAVLASPDAVPVDAGATPRATEVMRFRLKHPRTGDERTVEFSRSEVADGMEDTLYEKLGALVCECGEPVGETNVVEHACVDYIDEFELLPVAPVAPLQSDLAGAVKAYLDAIDEPAGERAILKRLDGMRAALTAQGDRDA